MEGNLSAPRRALGGWYYRDNTMGVSIGPFQSEEDAKSDMDALSKAYAETPEPRVSGR